MKKTISIFAAIFITCIYNDSFSQTYNGVFQEFFLGRQPSARAEAMGKGLSAVTGDALSYYYNPAGMASLQGLNVNGSLADPYYFYDNAKYNFFGASYKIKKYGTVGFSRDYYTYGLNYEYIRYDEFGNPIGTYTFDPDITNYRMTLSYEVIKNLFVGLNLNLMDPDLVPQEITVGNETTGNEGNVFYFDLGVIKSFNIESKKLNQNIDLGMSLINVNSAKYSIFDEAQADKLPVIFRLGASYDLIIDDKNISPKLKSYNFLVNVEYEDLFNSKYYSGFHGGLEFTFLEILSLRAGYFTMENETYKIDTSGFNIQRTGFSTNEFTYGFGLNIPIRQLTDSTTPLEVKFDYVNIKQPALNENKDGWDNFQVYTIIVNWIF